VNRRFLVAGGGTGADDDADADAVSDALLLPETGAADAADAEGGCCEPERFNRREGFPPGLAPGAPVGPVGPPGGCDMLSSCRFSCRERYNSQAIHLDYSIRVYRTNFSYFMVICRLEDRCNTKICADDFPARKIARNRRNTELISFSMFDVCTVSYTHIPRGVFSHIHVSTTIHVTFGRQASLSSSQFQPADRAHKDKVEKDHSDLTTFSSTIQKATKLSNKNDEGNNYQVFKSKYAARS
jgi:hypothetical protein